MPVLIEAVDTEERIRAVLDEMVGDGLITLVPRRQAGRRRGTPIRGD